MRCDACKPAVGLSDERRRPVLRQHPKRPQRSQNTTTIGQPRQASRSTSNCPRPITATSHLDRDPPRSTAIHRYALLAPALALTEIVEGVSSSLPAPSFGLSQVRMCPVNIIVISKVLHLYRRESVQHHQSGCACGKPHAMEDKTLSTRTFK
jgi:hypothetical protein